MTLIEVTGSIHRSPASIRRLMSRIGAFWRDLLQAEERYANAVSQFYVSPFEVERSARLRPGPCQPMDREESWEGPL